jgi:hypothetical protein
LGSGYDTNYFWIQELINNGELPEKLRGKITYIEVDYLEITMKKLNVIRKSDKLMKLICLTEEDKQFIHEKHINTFHYKLFS